MHMGWQCSKTAATDNKEEKKNEKEKKLVPTALSCFQAQLA